MTSDLCSHKCQFPHSWFPLILKVICQSGCHWIFLTTSPTLTSGQPESPRATCICSRSPSTSAPLSCPQWDSTASFSTSRPSRADARTRWDRLCSSSTLGWKVGRCRNTWVNVYTSHSTITQCCFPDDPVHMPLDVQREEYIKSDYGVVYMGSHQNISRRPWLYGQVGP